MVVRGSEVDFIENYGQITEYENIRRILKVKIHIQKVKLDAIRIKAFILYQISQDDRENFRKYMDDLNKLQELETECREKLDLLLSAQIKYAGVFGYYEEQEMFKARLSALDRHQSKK